MDRIGKVFRDILFSFLKVIILYQGITYILAADSPETSNNLLSTRHRDFIMFHHRFADAMDRFEERILERTRTHADKPTILILGPIGDGKSTVATMLSDVPLTGTRNTRGQPVIHGHMYGEVHISDDNRGTLNPASYYHEDLNSIIWDCPGWEDNPRSVTGLMNKATISRIAEVSPSLKIIVVLSENRLFDPLESDSVPSFFTFLATIFCDQNHLNLMTSLVLTHITDENDSLTKLKDICKDHENPMSPSGRNLLQYILTNQSQRITFVPIPRAFGQYDFNHNPFKEKIQRAHSVERPLLNLTLSPASTEHLGILAKQLNEEIFNRISHNIDYLIDSYKRRITTFEGAVSILRNDERQRIEALARLELIPPRRPEIDIFGHIEGMPAGVQSSILQKLNLLANIIKLYGPDVNYTPTLWYTPLRDAVTKLRLLFSEPEKIIHGDELILKGGVIGTSDLRIALNGLNQKTGSITVEANTLLIDEDLQLPHSTRFSAHVDAYRALGTKSIKLQGNTGITFKGASFEIFE